jgi:hypothetical protein
MGTAVPAAASEDYATLARKHEVVLRALNEIDLRTRRANGNVQSALQITTRLAALDEFRSACELGVGRNTTSDSDPRWFQREHACDHASRATEIVGPWVKATAEEHVDALKRDLNAGLDDFTSTGVIDTRLLERLPDLQEGVRGQKRLLGPLFVAAQRRAPAGLFQPIRNGLVQYAKALPGLLESNRGRRGRRPGSTSAAGIERAVTAAQIRGQTPKLVKSHVRGRWNTQSSESGDKLRKREATVVIQAKDEAFCRSLDVELTQFWDDTSNKWVNDVTARLSDRATVLKCGSASKSKRKRSSKRKK